MLLCGQINNTVKLNIFYCLNNDKKIRLKFFNLVLSFSCNDHDNILLHNFTKNLTGKLTPVKV